MTSLTDYALKAEGGMSIEKRSNKTGAWQAIVDEYQGGGHRFCCAVVAVDSKIFVFGAAIQSKPSTTAHGTPSTCQSSSGPRRPFPRSRASCLKFKKHMFFSLFVNLTYSG